MPVPFEILYAKALEYVGAQHVINGEILGFEEALSLADAILDDDDDEESDRLYRELLAEGDAVPGDAIPDDDVPF